MHLKSLISLAVLASSTNTCSATPSPPATTQAAILTRSNAEYINYTTVTGFFLQDNAATNASTFDYTATNFGLINQTYTTDGEVPATYTQWQRFEHYVWRLNRASGRKVQYKVLFMGRHGEGYHNAAEAYYGTPAWNCYWSIRDGNATTNWADARITSKGVYQAQIASAFWASRIALQKIPLPESYYTSPLTRCLQTANITFSTLPLTPHRPFVPTVKEFFREGISGHTCDRRSTKSQIQAAWPGQICRIIQADKITEYIIEPGFTEDDELWKPLMGEVAQDQDIRSKKVLDDVFSSDHNTWLSITSHSGEIASLLRVLGHRTFGLSTGAVIPVLVKAETISGAAPASTTVPWTTISTCSTMPPLPSATS